MLSSWIINQLMPCAPAKKGFSLFETLVVMTLLATITAASTFVVHTFMQGFVFMQNVNLIAMDIQQVQAYAVQNSLWCRIVFFTTTPSYYIYHGTQLVGIRSFPATFRYPYDWNSLQNNTISFDGTGAPSTAGTLRLQDSSGRSASVVIYVGSGIVKVTIQN